MTDAAAQSDIAKKAGNKALGQGDVDGAIKHFTRAIELVPTNHVLFSNRSVAYAKQGEYQKALADAEEAVKLQPEWSKAYGRKGTALFHLNRFEASIEAYKEGLALDADNTVLKDGLDAAQKKLLASEANVHAEERIHKAKYSQAVSFLDQAVELDPGNSLYVALCKLSLFGMPDTVSLSLPLVSLLLPLSLYLSISPRFCIIECTGTTSTVPWSRSMSARWMMPSRRLTLPST